MDENGVCANFAHTVNFLDSDKESGSEGRARKESTPGLGEGDDYDEEEYEEDDDNYYGDDDWG